MLRKSIYIFLLSFFILGAKINYSQTTPLDSIGVDDLFVKAKNLAFDGNRNKAREACYNIMKRSPTYWDAYVLAGRTYSWDKQYDSARAVLTRVITNRKKIYYDALDAIVDMSLWSDHYEDAVKYTDLGIKLNMNDENLLYKKARALNNLTKSNEASEILNQILTINPANKQAQELLQSIKDAKKINKVTIAYTIDAFKHYAPWHLGYIQYGRRLPITGSTIFRLSYANRYGYNGYQGEMDMYPSLWKGAYAFVNLGYSKSSVFPHSRAGLEIFQKLPKSFEFSIGSRYLNFDNTRLITSDSNKVLIYTESVGKYWGNYWFSLRSYFVPGVKSYSKSANLSVRRYFDNPETYLALTVGGGYSPDEHWWVLQETGTTYLKSEKIYLDFQKRFAKWYVAFIGAGVANEEWPTKGTYRLRYVANAGFSYLF